MRFLLLTFIAAMAVATFAIVGNRDGHIDRVEALLLAAFLVALVITGIRYVRKGP